MGSRRLRRPPALSPFQIFSVLPNQMSSLVRASGELSTFSSFLRDEDGSGWYDGVFGLGVSHSARRAL
jgi:hypothetical protein